MGEGGGIAEHKINKDAMGSQPVLGTRSDHVRKGNGSHS